MSKSLPEYWFAAVRRMPPVEAPVLTGSTPVVSFGDPSRAAVATLGINPSAKEFCDRDGLLTGPERRLATLDSVGAERLDQLTDCQVAAVAKHCQDYFERQPYRKWFDPLDRLLRTAIGVSYYDRTACHLDLIQWATDPVWGQIGEQSIKRALLRDGEAHLRAQLAQERFLMILLNGGQVLHQVRELGLADLDEEGCLPLGKGSCSLYVGDEAGVRWVGWSANLQSSWGVTAEFKQALAERIRDVSVVG